MAERRPLICSRILDKFSSSIFSKSKRFFLSSCHFLSSLGICSSPVPSHDYRRSMHDEEVHRNSGSRSSDTSKRCVAVFSSRFFLPFFLRGTCCRVARQTRGMPGLIKDGTRSPTPDKSFPKAVTLRTKRENENARLESTLFSRSSEQHERDGSELDEKFESALDAVLCKSLARDDRKFTSPTFEKQNTPDDNRYRVNEMGKSCPVRGIFICKSGIFLLTLFLAMYKSNDKY